MSFRGLFGSPHSDTWLLLGWYGGVGKDAPFLLGWGQDERSPPRSPSHKTYGVSTAATSTSAHGFRSGIHRSCPPYRSCRIPLDRPQEYWRASTRVRNARELNQSTCESR